MIRVVVHFQAPAGAEAAVERAYHEVSAALSGTPGLLGNTLQRDADRPGRFLVVSDWESLEAYEAWVRGPLHKAQTAPLHPYIDCETRVKRLVVVATYGASTTAA
jgi:heme oxygenase (mycobilin-producing)